MSTENKATAQHPLYSNNLFSWEQVRDCIAGSNAIKRKQEIYLPMPSAMYLVQTDSKTAYKNQQLNYTRLPYYHPNPAYMAYLQRARFPDITANSLRGIAGIAMKEKPEIELPSIIDYLESDDNYNQENLSDMYEGTFIEIMESGKQVLVADINSDNTFSIVQYCAESNTNWEYIKIGNLPFYTSVSLIDSEDEEVVVQYEMVADESDKEPYVVINRWKDDKLIETKIPQYIGKKLRKIPIVCVGALDNFPEPGVIPLLGISDIAITLYQESADLRQAHFLTCNPTLFLFGVQQKEVPSVIGSSVIVSLANPEGRAEYPNTDTSALDHIKEYSKDLLQEAVSYGAAFLSNSNVKESGDALSIRNAGRSANIVKLINNITKAYQQIIQIILDIVGSAETFIFEGNKEFAEMILTSQDISSLLTSWLQGGIDHDTFLDNLRDAGYIKEDKTNDEIKSNILSEAPLVAQPIVSDKPADKGGAQ